MSKQFPHPFGAMAKEFRAYRKHLPAKVSKIAMEEFDKNFQAQGLRVSKSTVEKWKPRQRPDRGRKGRELGRRAILIKTGELRGSMRLTPTYDYASVSNATPYARIHNRGGRIKGQMRAYATNLRSGLTRLRQSGNPAMMPARPFMVTTPLLLEVIGDAVLKDLGDIFNKAPSK